MSTKRPASSPLEANEKRSLVVEDPEDTIIYSDFDYPCTPTSSKPSGFRASTPMVDRGLGQFDTLSAVGGGGTAGLRQVIHEVFDDPAMIAKIASAVATQVSGQLREEMADLKRELVKKDNQIMHLQDRVDELEQYSRRNSVRISGIPEEEHENTDEIVQKVAESLGVEMSLEAIDRSHRAGRKGDYVRPILCKFVSYRAKRALMTVKKQLFSKDPTQIFPSLSWPTRRSQGGGDATVQPDTGPRIFINDDLTKTRAEVAGMARQKKREKAIEDTWCRDGVIFIKYNDTIHRITTKREVAVF